MANLRKTELATAVNITTTYAGEFAGEYIAAALLSASTIDDGGINSKSKYCLQRSNKKISYR